MRSKEKLKYFWGIIRDFKWSAALLFLIMITCSVAETIGLGLVMPFLEIITTQNADHLRRVPYVNNLLNLFPANYALIVVGGLIFILIMLKNILFVLRTGFSVIFVQRLRKIWTLSIMEKYMYAEYPFHVTRKQGVLLNNLIREPSIAAKAIHNIIEFSSQLILFTFLYALVLLVNWKITLVMSLFGGVLIAFVINVSNKYSTSVGKKQLLLNQETTAIGSESVSGIRQIKIFCFEQNAFHQFKIKLTQLIRIVAKYMVIVSLPKPIIESLVVFGVIAAIIYIKYVIQTPLLGIVPIIGLFVVIAQRLFPTFSVLFSSRMNINTYIPSLKLVQQLHTTDIDVEDLNEGIKIRSLENDISFQNLQFAYEGNKPLFRDLSLVFPKGKMTAIVGPSGSGKSTIVDLLVGFYKAQSGEILINGIDISKINKESWRNLVGYVSQDTYLFNATVEENILMGNPSASHEEVEEAARKANAESFIQNLPSGYKAMLGDRGLNLSGGQRQRIAVERAIIRDPQLLIFDEATSELDIESERLIQQTIKDLKGNKTLIVITHRISSVKNADLIYVIDNGQVVESGSFFELIKDGFGYAGFAEGEL
jgi:ABC-type multidrug transport system fused ATPase/permease subunit